MVLVSVAAITLAATLGFFRFEETFRFLIQQRMRLTAEEVARGLEVGLDLGLPVEAQETLPDLLGQQLSDHPDLAAVAVVACDGTALMRQGEWSEPAETVAARLTKPSWTSRDGDAMTVGLKVSDALGGCAAGVIVARSTTTVEAAMATVGRQYALVGGLAALATLIAMVGAAALFSRARPPIIAINSDLDHLIQGRRDDFAAGETGQAWEDDLVAAYANARPALTAIADKRRDA